jgi:acyl carrier protein
MEIPDKLLEFLDELRQPASPVRDPDEDLHLDSLNLLRLIAFFESDLGVTVEDDQLVVDNFANLRAISRLLEGNGARIT